MLEKAVVSVVFSWYFIFTWLRHWWFLLFRFNHRSIHAILLYFYNSNFSTFGVHPSINNAHFRLVKIILAKKVLEISNFPLLLWFALLKIVAIGHCRTMPNNFQPKSLLFSFTLVYRCITLMLENWQQLLLFGRFVWSIIVTSYSRALTMGVPNWIVWLIFINDWISRIVGFWDAHVLSGFYGLIFQCNEFLLRLRPQLLHSLFI